MAEPHRDALAPLQARGDPLRAVPYGQGAHCGGLRLLRALQPATSRCALDHRFGPRRNYVNVLSCDEWVAKYGQAYSPECVEGVNSAKSVMARSCIDPPLRAFLEPRGWHLSAWTEAGEHTRCSRVG